MESGGVSLRRLFYQMSKVVIFNSSDCLCASVLHLQIIDIKLRELIQ